MTPMIVDFQERRQAEAAIAAHYWRAHGAIVSEFMPQLMTLHMGDGSPVGVLGWRSAATAPLFLENYLDAPIESLLGGSRGGIVEVGNMVAQQAGGSRHLIAALTALLQAGGYSWSVFTATARLRNVFSRLGIPMRDLGLACPERVDNPAEWGRYYEAAPRVTAVSVAESADALLGLAKYANTMRSTQDALAVA
ncbi:MAG: hypothetical protein ACI8W8_000753 [Rhodothermales bacterium]|jgi:hypothetical protein